MPHSTERLDLCEYSLDTLVCGVVLIHQLVSDRSEYARHTHRCTSEEIPVTAYDVPPTVLEVMETRREPIENEWRSLNLGGGNTPRRSQPLHESAPLDIDRRQLVCWI